MNVHSSIIHSSQKVKTTQMSINWWTTKQKVVYSENGVLFGNKKEWITDICYRIDEPGKHYAKWRKPVTKDHIYIMWFLHMKFSDRKFSIGTKSILVDIWGWWQGWWRWWGIVRLWLKGARFLLGQWKCSKIDLVIIFNSVNMLKTTEFFLTFTGV